MVNTSDPPKSPTLLPPHKSVELEDPGAHELGAHCFPWYTPIFHIFMQSLGTTSENEDDVFADASEGQGLSSRSNSPIPTTRVEKVSLLRTVIIVRQPTCSLG